jgi:AbrB family looped-hinge helix DNA binding protein
MPLATVSEKGWVVIPKEYRDLLGLKKGSKVVVIYDGEGVYIAPPSADPAGEALGKFADGPSLTEALLEERAAERRREDEKVGTPLLTKSMPRKRRARVRI